MKKLGFGLMRLPIRDNDNSKIDLKKFKLMADKFIQSGFTYFDTAYFYHGNKSESAFNKAVVKRYPREAYTITDKLPIKDVKKIEDNEIIFNRQLKRLGVDYVDYYFMHAVSLKRFNLIKDLGTFEFMQRIKKEGRAKHLGFSYHDSAKNLDYILSQIGSWVEVVQLQLNYLDWNDKNVESRKCYEVCKKYGKKVIVMEPVKGGTLANIPLSGEQLFKSVNPNSSNASWAIRYAASLEDVMMVLSGMSNMEQLIDNISYMTNFKPISQKEKTAINKVVKIIENDIKVKCTACAYCVAGCPVEIKIPEWFKIYNNVHRSYKDYKALIDEGYTKPNQCLKCGACEDVCPQKLTIREYLQDISKEI